MSNPKDSIGLQSTKLDTLCVHAGITPDPLTGAIFPPIYQNTTFVQESVERYLEKGFSYSRTANPTVNVLETKIADLESGKYSACFTTGMAATCTVFSAFLRPGDHCLVTNCSYGGTNRAAREHFALMNIEFEFVDMSDVNLVRSRMKQNTKMIFSETPTNPILSLADVAELSKLAHSATHQVIHVCDSTFATPYIMQPLELGADITLISTTKYYDGHNITTGGAVVTNNKEIGEKIRWQRNVLGNIMAPQTAFYQLQTVKTLGLRIRHQSATALAVAQFLEKHPKVLRVGYPGLPSFPQRELADKQHKSNLHGGMVWFEVLGGTDSGVKMMNSMKRPWTLCENLGTVESICTCPAVFTHANMRKEDRLAVGITDGFIRLSCGTEDCVELIKALSDGLDAISPP